MKNRKGFTRDCKAGKCVRKEKQDNEMLFIICFNSNSEMQAKLPLRGKWAALCEILQGWTGRGDLGGIRETTYPVNLPLGYRVSSAERELLGVCPKPRGAGAAGGHGWDEGPPPGSSSSIPVHP